MNKCDKPNHIDDVVTLAYVDFALRDLVSVLVVQQAGPRSGKCIRPIMTWAADV